MYAVYWVFGNNRLPVKDIILNPRLVFTPAAEEEKLTLEEAEARLKDLSERNPNLEFVMREE